MAAQASARRRARLDPKGLADRLGLRRHAAGALRGGVVGGCSRRCFLSQSCNQVFEQQYRVTKLHRLC